MFPTYGALKDFLPIVEQLTRLPGKLLARMAALVSVIATVLGWMVVRSSSGFFSWLPFAVGVFGLVASLFFAWRRYRLESSVGRWMDDVVNTVDGEAKDEGVDYSAMYEGQRPADSQDLLVIDEEGNPSGAPGAGPGTRPGSAGKAGTRDVATDDAVQRQHDAMLEATQPRDTWMPRVEAAQRAAIAAAGGTVNAPYLKDDLRVTIVSAIFAAIAIPASTFFIFVAFFSLL